MSTPVISAEWDEGAIECLRTLWDAGLSTAEIGRRMARTTNSIIGKVHRMRLPPRPSPIIRDGDPKRPYQQRIRVKAEPAGPITLAPLASDSIVLPVAMVERKKPEPPKPVVKRELPVGQCCWLLGDRKPWRRCDAPTEPGLSWCLEHCLRGYANYRQRGAEVSEVAA